MKGRRAPPHAIGNGLCKFQAANQVTVHLIKRPICLIAPFHPFVAQFSDPVAGLISMFQKDAQKNCEKLSEYSHGEKSGDTGIIPHSPAQVTDRKGFERGRAASILSNFYDLMFNW